MDADLGAQREGRPGYSQYEITGKNQKDQNSRSGYSFNAVELLISVICESVKARKLFPRDEAATKVVYLTISAARKTWMMSIRNCSLALIHFMVVFRYLMGLVGQCLSRLHQQCNRYQRQFSDNREYVTEYKLSINTRLMIRVVDLGRYIA